MNRNIPVVATVLLLHIAAIWALHTGLLRRAFELVVPVQLLATVVEQPKAEIAPPRIAPAPPLPKPLVKPERTLEPTPPAPVAVPDPAPDPAPVLATTAPAPVTVAQAAVAAAPIAPAAPAVAQSVRPAANPAPAPPRIELPSSDAAYLQNPRPSYPAMSKKLNEQGTVYVNVLIGPDGLAQRADISRSSGFDRLDKVALATVLKWRYLPGRRDGTPEAMWYIVPLVFALE